MSGNNGSFGNFVSGILVGGLVGAAVAILMAPQSGEKTIAELKNRTDEIRSELERAAENYKKQADNLLESVQTEVEDVSQQAEEATSK
ncbi:MAG: YtxH domain-containing protein [Anaerolineales bacterium]